MTSLVVHKRGDETKGLDLAELFSFLVLPVIERKIKKKEHIDVRCRVFDVKFAGKKRDADSRCQGSSSSKETGIKW